MYCIELSNQLRLKFGRAFFKRFPHWRPLLTD